MKASLASSLAFALLLGCGPSRLELGAGAYSHCDATDGGNAKCQATSAAFGGGTDCALIDGIGTYYCVSDSTCAEAKCPAGKSCVLDRTATPTTLTCR